jgi:diaminopimelate epimerase
VTFTKAQAYGNDFLLVAAEAVGHGIDLPGLARRACDRHHGIGADGLMVVDRRPEGAVMRLFNADGSHAELSGNGVRCVAAWLTDERSLAPGATLRIDTDAGPRPMTLVATAGSRHTFRGWMGEPDGLRQVEIAVDGRSVTAVVLNVGNPQCVVLGPPADLSNERLHTIAAPLAVHPFFPAGTNVELASVEAPDRVRMLIWERGVGPTESSGTGACAAAVAAAAYGGAGRDVEVIAPGGAQRVEWTADGLWLTGWAEVVTAIDSWNA